MKLTSDPVIEALLFSRSFWDNVSTFTPCALFPEVPLLRGYMNFLLLAKISAFTGLTGHTLWFAKGKTQAAEVMG